MTWAVFCDFDGTVSTEDSTDLLLERYAAPEWREIEDLWARGAIGSAECMRRQVELVRATVHEIDRLADGLTMVSGFPEFVQYCERRAIPLSIVSDGLDYVIERFLGAHGLNRVPIFANHLRVVTDNRYTLDSPLRAAGCGAGTCKCRILEVAGDRSRLFIGDGRSDFCASQKVADLVVAKGPLLQHCQNHGIPCVPFHDFTCAMRILEQRVQAAPPDAPFLAPGFVPDAALP